MARGQGGSSDVAEELAAARAKHAKKKGKGLETFGNKDAYPLGVGKGYTTTVGDYTGKGPKGRAGRFQGKVEQGPRYFTGAAVEVIGTLGTDDLLELQSGLKRLGLLDDVTGIPNSKTKDAMALIMGNANAAGLSWQNWLGQKLTMLDQAGIDSLGSSGTSRRALTLQLANPDEIKADVKEQSTALLGGNYAGDPQHYVDEIHAQQTKQQTDYYNQTGGATGNADGGGPGGTTYDPASVKALIMKEHPGDYSVEQTGSNAQAVLESLIGRHSPELRG